MPDAWLDPGHMMADSSKQGYPVSDLALHLATCIRIWHLESGIRDRFSSSLLAAHQIDGLERLLPKSAKTLYQPALRAKPVIFHRKLPAKNRY